MSWVVLHCCIKLLLQKSILWVLCDCSCKAFWLEMCIMNLHWFKDSCLPHFSFATNQTNPNTTIKSLSCLSGCVWVLHYCISSLFIFVQQWHYLIFEYLIKSALEFCKVRIKLSSTPSKACKTCFLISSHCHHQPLTCMIHTFRNNYDACFHL